MDPFHSIKYDYVIWLPGLGYINENDRIFDVKEINAKYMLAYESRPNKTTPSKFTFSSIEGI